MEHKNLKCKRWTNEEVEILKKHFKAPIQWDNLLQLLPNRTRDTIHKKAQSLKLKPYDYLYIGSQGYLIKGKYRNRSSKTYLHRVIYENYHGIKLTSNDIIHHKDGNKLNNDISNLELLTRAEHIKMHKKELLKARASKKI